MKFTVHTVGTKLAKDEELKRTFLQFQHKAASITYLCTVVNGFYRLAKRAPV